MEVSTERRMDGWKKEGRRDSSVYRKKRREEWRRERYKLEIEEKGE